MIRSAGPFPALFLTVLAALLLAAGRGGTEEARQDAAPPPPDVTTDGAPAAETDEQAGSLEGGVEYFTVTNRGEEEWNLSSFTLNAVNPETGELAKNVLL